MTARSFVGLVLLALLVLSLALGQLVQPTAVLVSRRLPGDCAAGCPHHGTHPPLRRFGATWLATVGVDIATFALLQVLQGRQRQLHAAVRVAGADLRRAWHGLDRPRHHGHRHAAAAGRCRLALAGAARRQHHALRAGRADRHRPVRGRAAGAPAGAAAGARGGAGSAQPQRGAAARAGERPGDRDPERGRAGDRRARPGAFGQSGGRRHPWPGPGRSGAALPAVGRSRPGSRWKRWRARPSPSAQPQTAELPVAQSPRRPARGARAHAPDAGRRRPAPEACA